MLDEVHSSRAEWNDDGWALSRVSEELEQQPGTDRYLIVISDGLPSPSPRHRGAEWKLENVVERITKTTGQKIIGLGVGPGTRHVEDFYPYARGDIPLNELLDVVAAIVDGLVEDPLRRGTK
jgi:hypothetical protein